MTTRGYKRPSFRCSHYLPQTTKSLCLYIPTTNTMASINESCARMAASLAAIDAAKKRAVVLDTIINPKQMKTTTVVKKIIIRTAAPKPAEPKAAEAKVVTPKSTAAKGVERNAIVAPSAPVKPKAKKSSALNKLVKGKKFDFSA
ncbi:hypothetical protein ATCVMO0605SPH_727L [Acanthocystis turfacea Chlorella virus MO0605SPH]|nr:hypothetical protein ATCVMO0605SPH_727L [Acanthocystis turfacea Chlorella virus MO0605SPH]AGE60195.1 hypothetical protein ATCVWI0606_744L [Acanthocystis turfacea Chlorella virus WI0606]